MHLSCLANVKFTWSIKKIVSAKENHFPREFVALSSRNKNKNTNLLLVSPDKFSPCRRILISNFYFSQKILPGKQSRTDILLRNISRREKYNMAEGSNGN